MRIGIVGAGITGLTAAWRLSQKGHQVTVYEKKKYAGGLAAGFKEKGWDWSLEHFFHHLFTSDQAAKNLIKELGLFDKLLYIQAKTSIFKRGKISQFDSPATLLTFPYLPFLEKTRMGATIAYLKGASNWQPLEKTTASSWLSKTMGENAYRLLWQPLLQGKFAKSSDQISMAWFWARIKKRSSQLGHIEGGFQILINKLAEEIKKHDGKILLRHEIQHFDDLDDRSKFDRIIFTTPSSTFLKITPALSQEYKEKLQKLKMLGALNLILVLKEKFLTDGTYWLNISEPGFPFVAVVEHTNFVNPTYYGGNHLVYVGGYYPQNHPYFKMTKKQILNKFLPCLQKINPTYHLSPITYHLFKSLYAQPIIPTNYSKLIPKMKTPLPKVYLANMQMVYPWDRGINYAIELGGKIADAI